MESSWIGTVMRLLCLRVVIAAIRKVSCARARDAAARSAGEGEREGVVAGGCP